MNGRLLGANLRCTVRAVSLSSPCGGSELESVKSVVTDVGLEELSSRHVAGESDTVIADEEILEVSKSVLKKFLREIEDSVSG